MAATAEQIAALADEKAAFWRAAYDRAKGANEPGPVYAQYLILSFRFADFAAEIRAL